MAGHVRGGKEFPEIVDLPQIPQTSTLADYSTDQIREAIETALAERDMPAVASLVAALAIREPAEAQTLIDALHIIGKAPTDEDFAQADELLEAVRMTIAGDPSAPLVAIPAIRRDPILAGAILIRWAAQAALAYAAAAHVSPRHVAERLWHNPGKGADGAAGR
jgi:hypothetical protein